MAPRKVKFNEEKDEKLMELIKNREEIIDKAILHADCNRHHYKLRNYLCNIILKRAGIETDVRIFGSRMIGIGTRNSDLDMSILLPISPNKSLKDHQIDTLNAIKGTIIRTKIWKYKILIRDTRVPFLRITFLPLDLDLDIVVSSPIAIWDSKIFRYLLSLQPELKGIFFFLNIWIRTINGVKFKKMILFYLVIFYMQRHNFIPSLKSVLKEVPKKIVDGYEVQYDDSRSKDWYKLNDLSEYADLCIYMKFFKFYAGYNFGNCVIDMHSGKSITRSSYKADKDFNLNAPVCMTAPLDFRRNISKLIGKSTLEQFKKVCQKSVPFLENVFKTI